MPAWPAGRVWSAECGVRSSRRTRWRGCAVPIFRDGSVIGEIDIDSALPGAFGDADRELLERVAAIIAGKI